VVAGHAALGKAQEGMADIRVVGREVSARATNLCPVAVVIG
jgi:hypothetical protein